MKKYITLLLLLTIFNLLLTGCKQPSYVNHDENPSTIESSTTLTSNEMPLKHDDGRSIVTLSVYYPGEDIRQAVTVFNQSNPDYYVELLSGVGDDNAPSINRITAGEYWTRETLDIFAGKGPDIFTKTLLSEYNTYIEKGVLEDLTPYIEKDLKPDDYLPSSLYAYAREDKIYALESGFSLALSVGSKDIFGDMEGWTFSEMQKILKENSHISVYRNDYSVSGAGSFLSDYLAYGNPDYTDFETLRKCIEFDKNRCLRLAEGEKVILGENVLVENITLSNALEWADYEALYEKELTPVGYIDEQNTGIFHNGFGWSINAASKQKEGAWAFLRFLLSEEFQREYNTSQFSPLKCLLEEQLDYYSTPIEASYFDMELNDTVSYKGHILKKTSNEYWRQHQYWKDIYIEGLSEEQIRQIHELINRSRPISSTYDVTLNTLIQEEASAYFNNSRSLDDVMKNIENRVTLYLAEQE